MHGRPRQGPEMTGFLAAFHRISMIPPSIQHLGRLSTHPSAVRGYRRFDPRTSGPGNWTPQEGAMIANLKGLWVRYRTHRQHRLDIQAFNRLMDARAAARRAA